ncbi:hypothetical protein [Candidatus Nanoperiomorbus periodonticus]|uniref:hypothetical protein n=1 Tax=Candidatus Nanoperiomorbus periodonticus TaxID=2171989 RepID=UPI0013EAACFA|nr:hypothetical protein [Candidatus Nanoperiomorbus periodonticus]
MFGQLDGYLPYDEGVIEPESRNRYLCDIRSLAEQNGQGDFFSKYFLEHGHISDDAYDSQVVLVDKPNHTASNVKDKLRQNDLSGFYVSGALMDPAMVAYPSPQLSKGALAQMFREALRFCAKDPNNPFTEGEGKYRFVVKGDDGKYVVKKGYFTYAQGADDSRRVSVWASTHQHEPYAGPDKTCGILLHLYDQLADDYAAALNKYLEEHPNDPDTPPADETDEDDNTCQKELKGLGYILCPGVSVISEMIDHLYVFFGDFLDWQFLSGNSGKQIQSYWSQFLSIANVILVIAFLVIIYSVATSTGLTNYDVKKMLPRLLLFAVVINVSFYICAVIADLSNIAGKGAYSMFAGMKKIGEDSAAQSLFMKAITDLFGVGAILFILFGLSFGITILISLITIIIAISVRNLGLALLVIVSPIAFALYIFPNEAIQRWGRRWFDMFIKMIIVYPVFMLVAGGSSLIRNIGGNIGAGLPIITELACAALPALSIIPLFKMSGDVLGRATSLVHGSQATAAVAKAGHDAIARSRAGQGAGRMRSNLLQAAQNRFGDVPLVGGALRSAGVNNAITAPDKQYNELDRQAMQSASEKVDGMSSAEQREGFLNGTANGQQIADTHTMRAIIAKQAPNATMADAQQSMQSVNARANWLQEHGREREADELRRDYANAMIENGKSGISTATLQSWADTGWEDDRFNANYSDAISSYATGLSAQAQADMSAANLTHMRQTLQNSAANGGNVAATDAGISNVRDQASSALSNRDMLSKMSATTRSALVDNSLLRSTGGQNLANTHKLANVYHDFNSGGANATAAATRAKALMSHADFSRMDAIDQSRLRTIASSGSIGRIIPVQIASWDRRTP